MGRLITLTAKPAKLKKRPIHIQRDQPLSGFTLFTDIPSNTTDASVWVGIAFKKETLASSREGHRALEHVFDIFPLALDKQNTNDHGINQLIFKNTYDQLIEHFVSMDFPLGMFTYAFELKPQQYQEIYDNRANLPVLKELLLKIWSMRREDFSKRHLCTLYYEHTRMILITKQNAHQYMPPERFPTNMASLPDSATFGSVVSAKDIARMNEIWSAECNVFDNDQLEQLMKYEYLGVDIDHQNEPPGAFDNCCML